jgi:hypothetical protein
MSVCPPKLAQKMKDPAAAGKSLRVIVYRPQSNTRHRGQTLVRLP